MPFLLPSFQDGFCIEKNLFGVRGKRSQAQTSQFTGNQPRLWDRLNLICLSQDFFSPCHICDCSGPTCSDVSETWLHSKLASNSCTSKTAQNEHEEENSSEIFEVFLPGPRQLDLILWVPSRLNERNCPEGKQEETSSSQALSPAAPWPLYLAPCGFKDDPNLSQMWKSTSPTCLRKHKALPSSGESH